MSDLDKLVAQAVEISVAGEALAIKPLKIGQMPAFLRAITPVMQQLGANANANGNGNGNGNGIDWLALLGEHGDDVLTAVSIAIGKPRVWVDALDADEAILVAAKVIEVNADFFTRTVMPRLNEQMGGLFAQASTATAGSTQSST